MENSRRNFIDNWMQISDKYLGSINDSVVLDFGCGGGDFLTEYCKRGCRAIGLEIVPERALVAKSKGLGPGVLDMVIGDCETPPFRDEVFNTIYCNQVLEHLNQPNIGFSNISRILKSNQRALISVPTWLNEMTSKTFGNWYLQIGRALIHRALDNIYNNKNGLLTWVLFSKINHVSGEVLFRSFIPSKYEMKSTGETLNMNDYAKQHIAKKLKHPYHKHCFTSNEWIELAKQSGLKTVDSWGKYGLYIVVEKSDEDTHR